MKKATLLMCLLLGVIMISSAQKKTPEVGKYYLFKENHVKDFCWNSKDPNATDIVVPDQWKDEPAVFLYFKNYYETIRLKSKQFAISYIAHYRIKIQDKSALEDFSEIYYSKYSHGNYSLGYQMIGRQKNFLGIKIIKPDGKEIEVKSEDFIEDEDGGKKVALPNLEVGDIIDYYQYTYDYGKTGYYVINEKFVIGGSYPIKHFDYQLLTNKHWEVIMTTGANGPEIEEERVGKNFYKFSVKGSDFEPSERVIWNYPYYSFPYIKLFVSSEPGFLADKGNARVLRTSKISYDDIKEVYGPYYEQDNKAANEYNSFLKYLKKNGKTNLKREEKLEEYYYYLRHIFKNKHYIYDMYNDGMSKSNQFANQMAREFLGSGYGNIRLDEDGTRYVSNMTFSSHIIYALNKMKIRYDIIVMPKRSYGPLPEILSLSETNYVIKARLKEPIYFFNPTAFTVFNDLPYTIEGVDAYSLYSSDKKVKNIVVKKTKLPVSAAKDNTTFHKMEVSLDSDDPKLLNINNNIIYSGEQMRSAKAYYLDKFEMIWEENDRYKTKKWGDAEESGKKVRVQMEEFSAAKEEERKDNFTELAKAHFETDDITMLEYDNLNTGNKPGEDDFRITFNCQVNDLVKKVGPNYVIKVGNMLGGQITLDEEDMDRTVDIYMNYPRTYSYEIVIKIPEGYEALGLDDFIVNVDNAAGSLVTTAEQNDGKVILTFKKSYNNNFEPKENWGMMKDFLIPASTYPAKEILLKKI